MAGWASVRSAAKCRQVGPDEALLVISLAGTESESSELFGGSHCCPPGGLLHSGQLALFCQTEVKN